jgi:protein gp37
MGNKSSIEWTERTWNCTSGCTKVSAGCANCYAERLVSTRLRHLPQNEGVTKDGHWSGVIRCHEDKLSEPLRRKKPTTYFVCSQSDLFHDAVPFEFIDKVFVVMALCPQHTFLLLTKRPDRMLHYLRDWCLIDRPRMREFVEKLTGSKALYVTWPLDNVWLGTSVENQKAADERIPHLLGCPASKRFLSCEPLLGSVDIVNALDSERDNPCRCGDGECHICWSTPASPIIDLVIVGGESGPNARPMHPDWARSLRDQCKNAGVPFFFKQWGEWAPMSSIVEHRAVVMDALGTQHSLGADGSFTKHHRPDCCSMYKVGKKDAGCLLDGIEYKEWPE